MNNKSKTIKTILFASLIAALILPFSAMDFADAAKDDSKKQKISEMKNRAIEELKEVDKQYKKDKKDNKIKKQLDKVKRDISKLELVEAIVSLPNWEHTSQMTDEDREKRQKWSQQLMIMTDEDESLRKVISNTNDSIGPIIKASHSQGSWDRSYHTLANGSIYCGAPINDGVAYEGTSDGLVKIYTSGSVFRNVWDYPTELYKTQFGGCAQPPNDHYSNTLKVVDVLGSASDCYIGTSSPTGTTHKYCADFDPGTLTFIYTKGTYDNQVYLESAGWGFGTFLIL